MEDFCLFSAVVISHRASCVSELLVAVSSSENIGMEEPLWDGFEAPSESVGQGHDPGPEPAARIDFLPAVLTKLLFSVAVSHSIGDVVDCVDLRMSCSNVQLEGTVVRLGILRTLAGR